MYFVKQAVPFQRSVQNLYRKKLVFELKICWVHLLDWKNCTHLFIFCLFDNKRIWATHFHHRCQHLFFVVKKVFVQASDLKHFIWTWKKTVVKLSIMLQLCLVLLSIKFARHDFFLYYSYELNKNRIFPTDHVHWWRSFFCYIAQKTHKDTILLSVTWPLQYVHYYVPNVWEKVCWLYQITVTFR